jgi:hypothetical protein
MLTRRKTAEMAPTDEEIDRELTARHAAHDQAVAGHQAASAAVAELQHQLDQAQAVMETTTDPAAAVAAEADARRHRAALGATEAATAASAARLAQTATHLERMVDVVSQLRMWDELAVALRLLDAVVDEASVHAVRAEEYAAQMYRAPGARQLRPLLKSMRSELARIEGERPSHLVNVANVMGDPLPEPEPPRRRRQPLASGAFISS